jgi:NAD(P)H-flavin reductase
LKTDENIYHPHPAKVVRIITENTQIKTFELMFTNPARNASFTYSPGQFVMVSVPHCGEAPISISSTPTQPGSLSLSVRKAGKLTNAMHTLKKGDVLGLRGPYGRPFPLEGLKGRDLLFVAGGIGLAPLRSVISYCLDKPGDYGKITLLYGSRHPTDIAFKQDLDRWRKTRQLECLLSVDTAGPDWQGQVGVVTSLFPKITPDPARTTALVCGPALMIRFVLADLCRLGFKDEDIFTTLERHMKCGIGICRHCHMDQTLVCVDGPVFSLSQLRHLKNSEFLA